MNLRTWRDYQALLKLVADTLGRNRSRSGHSARRLGETPESVLEKWGPTRLANAIVYTKGVWKWGWENGLLAVQMRFGWLQPPARQDDPSRPKCRGAADVSTGATTGHPCRGWPERQSLDVAGHQWALGNTDCALLPISAIDLENGWLNYPRQKTAIMRRIPLWPETIEAIRQVLLHRPIPNRGNERLLFVRGKGGSYAGQRAGIAVSQAFADTAKAANVTGRTFYDLRRTFQTIGEGAKDPVAVSAVMGHVAGSNDMSSVYRQKIDDDRLQAVVDVVRRWLYGTEGDGTDDRIQSTMEASDVPETLDMEGEGPVLLAFAMTFSVAG
jgi:hypothetical protein